MLIIIVKTSLYFSTLDICHLKQNDMDMIVRGNSPGVVGLCINMITWANTIDWLYWYTVSIMHTPWDHYVGQS